MALTLQQRRELTAFRKTGHGFVAPHSGLVVNKPAISKPDDIASVNQRQANESSVGDTETFDGPAVWLVAIAIICLLIAVTATKL